MIKNATQIRNEVNITEVISQYVTLRNRGTVQVGCCPFHDEKSPSFTVYPTSNTFKCFGCGEGGDAVHFLMEHKGMTYPEAIEACAKTAKIDVEYEQDERRVEFMEREKAEQQRRQILQDAMFNVHKYYAHENPLPQYCEYPKKAVEKVIADVDGRPIGANTAETFGICYAPDRNMVQASGFWDASILQDIGVIGKGEHGDYDFFRNRLLFRITDHRGRIVGLAGRRRRAQDAENKKAKYLNPKESLLYSKANVLFGLSENRKGIKDAGFAVLVEGYMDVVTPHDAGYKCMVAPCGTALTDAQAATLKRYTDEVVVLRDGDDAGFEAAKRDIEILVRAGLKTRVAIMRCPDALLERIEIQEKDILLQTKENAREDLDAQQKKRGSKLLTGMIKCLEIMRAERDSFKDPDTFFRSRSITEFQDWLEINCKDGIIWRVMLEVEDNRDDVFKKETATQVAATLLGLVESETVREYYVRELCKKENLGAIKSVLAGLIKVNTDNKNRKSNLNPRQRQDVINYGIYEQDNKYFISSDIGGQGWCVSNFTLKPIIFIEGAKESIRLVEITNEKKTAKILDINSKNFVELGPFKQTIEARGNFRFEGKPEHFGKVKAKVYDEMRTAYPIYTLGLHRDGFFTYANGLIANGKFTPVDEYGLVSHGDTRYYLPAFSKIRDHIKSDDVDNDYQDEQYYIYTEGELRITWKEWTELMQQVHGNNAVIGILYLCSAIIRDKIFERLDNMFPHLNLFGLPGSGKNQLAASLCAPFGKYRPPVHIVNATDAAFFRRIAQVRGGISWYDEYSNNADHKRVEALKQFADGTGRSRASMDNPNRTNSSQVNSACIISGQQQPTADIALFTRCISLNFSNTEFSQESKEKHQKLKKLEQEGRLTAFVAQLHLHRPDMLEHFHQQFEESYKRFQELIAGNPVMDRIVRSYTAMLTTFKLLQGKMEFQFSEEEVEQVLVKSILTQKESVYQENEVSIWWRMVEFFLANGDIEHGADMIVEEVPDETFDMDWKGTKENKAYRPAKRLLYLYLARVHPLYLERHQRQRNAKGLDVEALKYYLKASGAWEGFKRAKKFGGAVKQCLVFDADKLPFELEDTVAVLARKRRTNGEPEPLAAETVTAKTEETSTTVTTTIPELPF